ncbi:YraN family protein [Nocardia carnea]|uniref:YraN family protein n=1 Tax=Nocardia carnea TaxID=37328 RepID=UPI002453E5A9|nr:YraN family protein [Nocardia carnea]
MTDDPRTNAPADPHATRTELAARHLHAAGLEIVCRGWRNPYGVLDLVARDAGVTVFVAVTTGSRPGDPLAPGSMPQARQQRIRRLALLWLADHDGPRHRIRFDVVTVVLRTGTAPVIEHHRAVF